MKKAFPFLLLAVIFCAALVPQGHAATGLAIVCPVAAEEGKPIPTSCNAGAGQSGQLYKTPLVTDLVRVDPTRSVGQTSDWNNLTSYVWKKYGNLATGELYETCKSDLPDPSAFTDVAQCTAWAFVAKASIIPSFTVTPASGTAPLAVRVTWNVPGGTACQAGGAWTGAKAAAGFEDLTLTAGPKSFALTCTALTGPPAKGEAVITWTPATQNTDGSAYTNAKGYHLVSGTTSPPTTQILVTPASAATYTYTNLDPGTYYFMIRSINNADVTSDFSGIGSKVIPNTPTAVTWSATPINITVADPPAQTKPRAPVIMVQ